MDERLREEHEGEAGAAPVRDLSGDDESDEGFCLLLEACCKLLPL